MGRAALCALGVALASLAGARFFSAALWLASLYLAVAAAGMAAALGAGWAVTRRSDRTTALAAVAVALAALAAGRSLGVPLGVPPDRPLTDLWAQAAAPLSAAAAAGALVLGVGPLLRGPRRARLLAGGAWTFAGAAAGTATAAFGWPTGPRALAAAFLFAATFLAAFAGGGAPKDG